MKKKIIIFLIVFLLGTSGAKAYCYKRTCPSNYEYPETSYTQILETNSCTYDNVDDYYCTANDCAIKVTESGNSMGCGRCGYSYAWDSTTNRCDVNQNYNSTNNSGNSNDGSNGGNSSNKVYCGNITNIPSKIPKITSDLVKLIQIIVPIILIIAGSIDLVKGVVAQKEDEIKKGKNIFIKRLITAAIIFFVVAIAKFLFSVISNSATTNNIVDCIDCFVSNDCSR